MYNHDNKFDVDLQYGQAGERWLVWLGTDQALVEVKAERELWQEKGNAVFEFASRGKPSGIATTKADYWCHLFMEKDRAVMTYMFRILELKEFLKLVWKNPEAYGARITKGGDLQDGVPTSDVILLPISQLYRIGNPYAKTN